MTVKELIKILEELPEHATVYYEYDGSDTLTDIEVKEAKYEYNETVVIR